VKKLLIALAAVAGLYVVQNVAYMQGFDGGAAAAQCLDLHALYGPKDAMTHDACKDAAKAQRSIMFKLLGHRVFFQ
jgi:hypothetical protein